MTAIIENDPTAGPARVPGWFARAAQDLKVPRRPWLRGLPAIVLRSGEPLPCEAAGWVLAAAASVEAEAAVHDLFRELKCHARMDSLDAWTGAALDAWTQAGSPPRDACLLEAASRFGGDATVRVLREAVRRWTRDKQRLLALRGVDALGRIGSPAALEEALMLAEGTRDRGVAKEARQLLTAKALPGGVSPEEMEDHHLADCGLDARGERRFSYGPREFRVTVDGSLKLALRDGEGRRRKSLPPSAATDDHALAAAARAGWSEMRTTYPRVLRAHTVRLEQAMVSGRAWPQRLFRETLLAHPIGSRLARLLVWQTVAPQPQSFRVTEDLKFADAADDTVRLEADAPVRVAHPLDLAPEERRAWTGLFVEYNFAQPFQQLLRSIHRCGADLAEKTHLPAPAHAPLDANVLYGVLHHDGWQLARTGDASWKNFAADGVSAMLAYTGFSPQAMSRAPKQTISHCCFFESPVRPSQNQPPLHPMKLGDVPSVAFSETARRLERLTAPA